MDLIEYANQSPSPAAVIRKDAAPRIIDFASVIVRLSDNHRQWRPPKGFYSDVDNSVLP